VGITKEFVGHGEIVVEEKQKHHISKRKWATAKCKNLKRRKIDTPFPPSFLNPPTVSL
jgi:hypothetical protein